MGFFTRNLMIHYSYDCNHFGEGRSFHGVGRLGHVDREGQMRGITTCKVASEALASDVKAYDAGQIQVLV